MTGYSEISPARDGGSQIPSKVRMILLSWGLGVIILAGVLSFWIQSNQNHAAEERAKLQAETARKAEAVKLEQDRAMCQVISIILSAPEPLPGPAGDRSRAVRSGMRDYQVTLRCDQIR